MGRRRTSSLYGRVSGKNQVLSLRVQSPRILFNRCLGFMPTLFLWVVVLGMIVGAGYGLYQAKLSLMDKNEEFTLKEIRLKTNGTMSKPQIIKATGIEHGVTLYSLDLEEIKRRIISMPEVVEVEVKRDFPNAIRIKMQERVPVAWVAFPQAGEEMNTQSYLLTDDQILCRYDTHWYANYDTLPVIQVEKGDDLSIEINKKLDSIDVQYALNLVFLHRGARFALPMLETLKIKNFYTIEAKYTNGLTALYGVDNQSRQFTDLRDILSHASYLNKELEWVDLRPQKNIPARYKEQQKIALK